jgi:hypothetical protein
LRSLTTNPGTVTPKSRIADLDNPEMGHRPFGGGSRIHSLSEREAGLNFDSMPFGTFPASVGGPSSLIVNDFIG